MSKCPLVNETPCRKCASMKEIRGDAHISCTRPDPNMTGNEHGIRSGWFAYPFNFDPVWGTTECANYEQKEESNE